MLPIVQITASLFDPLGYLAIEPIPSQDLNTMRRRVNKVATLDANVVVNDRGYVDGDQDLIFRYQAEESSQDAIARRLIRLHSRVHVSTVDGTFLCVPLEYDPNPNQRELRFSVIEKVEG